MWHVLLPAVTHVRCVFTMCCNGRCNVLWFLFWIFSFVFFFSYQCIGRGSVGWFKHKEWWHNRCVSFRCRHHQTIECACRNQVHVAHFAASSCLHEATPIAGVSVFFLRFSFGSWSTNKCNNICSIATPGWIPRKEGCMCGDFVDVETAKQRRYGADLSVQQSCANHLQGKMKFESIKLARNCCTVSS